MIIKKMYYQKLQRNNYGIDWINSIGCSVEFEYDDINGSVFIVDYKKNESKLGIKYLDNEVFYIRTDHFKDCSIGKYLKKRTNDFKYKIYENLKDEKRDITITDRKVERIKKDNSNENRKYYKYKCNKCGFDCGEHYKDGEYNKEHWIREGDLINNDIGCACCKGIIVVPNINSIVAKEESHWMIKYFQGGYDEAKLYTKGSGTKINFKCPYCNKIKANKISINGLNTRKSIGCTCGDGFSYPEKFMIGVLNQLGVEFITQYSSIWYGKYRYDFYIPSLNMIIETHGEQHYKEQNKTSKFKKSLKEEQENDRIKKELALKNGIEHYVVIDCRYSDLDFIKNSILNSELASLFDLSNIDWGRCEEFALSNLVKEVCDYWNCKEEWETTGDLEKVFKVTNIRNYLKKGTKLGWCEYNPKEEMRKNGSKNGRNIGKRVEVFKDEISLGVFKSCAEIERQSKERFGTKLSRNRIYDAIKGRQYTHKGFKFKYV